MTKFYVAGHALIERESKYLIIRRSKINTYKPLKWDIPGGIVEPGETLETTIHREVNEETGLSIEIKRVLYVYTNKDQYPVRQTFQVVYLCEYSNGTTSLNPTEHDKYQWVYYDDIIRMDTMPFLRDLVHSHTLKEPSTTPSSWE